MTDLCIKFDLSKEQQEIEQSWLFTFGFGHAHPNKFVRIFGTFFSAREEMMRRFGPQWAFQYPAEKEQELKRFFITELKA